MILSFQRKDGSFFSVSGVRYFLVLVEGCEIVYQDGTFRFIDSSLASVVSGTL